MLEPNSKQAFSRYSGLFLSSGGKGGPSFSFSEARLSTGHNRTFGSEQPWLWNIQEVMSQLSSVVLSQMITGKGVHAASLTLNQGALFSAMIHGSLRSQAGTGMLLNPYLCFLPLPGPAHPASPKSQPSCIRMLALGSASVKSDRRGPFCYTGVFKGLFIHQPLAMRPLTGIKRMAEDSFFFD